MKYLILYETSTHLISLFVKCTFANESIQNLFTNFSYNQNVPQNYKIFSDVQKSSGQSQKEKKYAQALIGGRKLYN